MRALDKLREKIEKRNKPQVKSTPILDLVYDRVRIRIRQMKGLLGRTRK